MITVCVFEDALKAILATELPSELFASLFLDSRLGYSNTKKEGSLQNEKKYTKVSRRICNVEGGINSCDVM